MAAPITASPIAAGRIWNHIDCPNAIQTGTSEIGAEGGAIRKKTDGKMPMTKEEEALETGVLAVVYGLPVVIMELTMETATNVASPHAMAAPVNQFAHVPRFPSAEFKQVVRANVDTLYSSAFLDLSREPLVLSVPDTHGRYYLLPMFDAWTNVFAT